MSGSAAEEAVKKRPRSLSRGTVRTALLNQLRDYQLRNNRHVRQRVQGEKSETQVVDRAAADVVTQSLVLDQS
jgi:hypothetical protein